MAGWKTALGALLVAIAVAPPAPAQPASAAAPEAATPDATAPDTAGAPEADDAAPPVEVVRMGTGSVNGVYFPVGVAICRLANQHRPETGLRCAATASAGSVANLAGLRDGSFALAIVQSDSLAAAIDGSGPFASQGPDTGLRTVMSLYPEALTLVVRANAGVSRIEDIAGKRIDLGQPGSGTRALADALLAALGWTDASFAPAAAVAPGSLSRALCDGEIDGFLYAVGHPARLVQEVTTTCDARLVPIEGGAITALVDSGKWYVAATIPGGIYRGNPRPVDTFGVSAILATEAAVPDATVRVVAQSAADDLDMLRGLDPVLGHLDPAEIAAPGPAPLHPAAEAVFQAKGWQ